MSKSSFLKGTALLTITMLFSKILGFIYVIPFTKLVGTEGYILYEYAYKPYAIMLSLATLGLPAAVSKFISKYNELGDYETGRKLFKSGLIILTTAGILWASILYIGAPGIAKLLVGKGNESGNSIEDVIFVIRMVSFALIIVPPMALGRGFFQGFQKMSPTGISQLIEQLVRIMVILAASFIVMYYGSKEIKTAVGWSTFAATIGAISSVFVLIYYWYKYKKEILIPNKMITNDKPSLFTMYKELFYSSIPFVIVSLAIPVYQNIDIFSINPTLMGQGKTLAEAEYVNSIVALVQKITLLPIIFANAFALTLVPAITKSFIGGHISEMNSQITKTIQVIFFVTLPCAIFFLIFGEETFGILLGTDNANYGGRVTAAYAGISIGISFFLVTSAILQGINKQQFAVVSMLVGILAKASLSKWFIIWFNGEGTAYTTLIGFAITILLNFIIIKKHTGFKFSPLFKQSALVLLLSSVLGVILLLLKKALITTISMEPGTYLYFLTIVSISGLAACIIYFGISYKYGLLENVLGSKFRKRSN